MQTNQNLPIPALTPPSIPTFRIRIDSTTRVLVDNNEYAILCGRPSGYLLRRLDLPNIIEEFSFDEIDKLWDAGRLTIVYASVGATGRLMASGSVFDLLAPRLPLRDGSDLAEELISC